ncbi:MAG: zinc carboxypeptidase, partial [Phycisphaerales bacterium]
MAGVPAHAETSDHSLNTFVAIDVSAISAQELLDMGADIWGVRDDIWHLRVSRAMLDELSDRGVPFQIIHEDLQRAYEAYRQRWPLRRHGMPHTRSESFADYHDLESTEDILRRIAQTHSDIAVLEIIGYSIENRRIYALRISDDASIVDDEEPAVLIIGCHHAREWISVEVPLFLADYLTDNYRKDGTVTRLINYTEIWIIPVLNPDGFHYSWTTERWWRKNRRDNGDGTFGVDPNRNYPSIDFGGSGTSMDTSSEVYPGTEAFSEPETQAIRELIEGEDGRDFIAAISYHNYSQLVMYPFGYTSEPTEDADTFESLGMEMTRLINISHENPAHDYRYGQTSRVLYRASGDLTDWAYTDHGVLGFTIEVRPAGPPYFELPPNEIRPTCEENLPAFLHLAEETTIPGLKASDPDLDGFAGVDDYCPNSPSTDVDAMGCDDSEEDVDKDGIPNEEDACGDSLPGQLVDNDGCRVEALFALTITSNIESVEVEVEPQDIDAKGDGLAGPAGLTRDYPSETDIMITAAEESGGAVFRYWIADGEHLPAAERTISMTTSRDVKL